MEIERKSELAERFVTLPPPALEFFHGGLIDFALPLNGSDTRKGL